MLLIRVVGYSPFSVNLINPFSTILLNRQSQHLHPEHLLTRLAVASAVLLVMASADSGVFAVSARIALTLATLLLRTSASIVIAVIVLLVLPPPLLCLLIVLLAVAILIRRAGLASLNVLVFKARLAHIRPAG